MNRRFFSCFLLSSLFVLHLPLRVLTADDENDAEALCAGLRCRCVDRVVECSSMATAQATLESLRRRENAALRKFSCVNCTWRGDNVRLEVNVIDVDVSHNSLTGLASGSDKVLNLNVAHNLLASLDFTKHFPQLRRLYVSHNRLDTLTKQHLPSLAILDVSDNRIGHVDENAFAVMSELNTLNLSGNLIRHLHHEWFTPLRNLRHLDLARNHLVELNNLVFMPLSQLRAINLSHNQLIHIGLLSFQSVNVLERLDLSYNNLSTMPGDFCKWFHSLHRLDVSGNPLRSLANIGSMPSTANFTLIARDLRSLKSIDANDTSGLEGMTSLDLSGSALKTIDVASFQRLERLQELDLSNCSLRSLPRGLFLPLISLERVNLQGNAWKCDCGLKWLLYFFLHRQQLQLDSPAMTFCSIDESSSSEQEGAPLNVHEERLLDFLDRKLECENATIVNFTTNSQLQIGSTAVLFCEERGIPTPSLTWHSRAEGELHPCENGCFAQTGEHSFEVDSNECRGCQLARWICIKREEMCTNDLCRRNGPNCLHLPKNDWSCCQQGHHLKTAIQLCFANEELSTDAECLLEVATLSIPNFRRQNNTRILEQLNTCIDLRKSCLEGCIGNEECDDSSNRQQKCVEPAITCALDIFTPKSTLVSGENCQSRICSRGRKLYISDISRGDSG